MNRPLATLLAAGTALVMVFCGLVVVPLVANPAFACGQDPSAQPTAGGSFEQWSPVQVQHAAEIVAVGIEQQVPPRGWVIALATAIQESTLRNLANDNPKYPLVVAHSLAIPHDGAGHDHDSVGLFQQRPLPPEGEGAWGTVAELMTPNISAAKFYAALQRVDGWQTMALTDAAQAVQHSGTPRAYAEHEDEASRLAAYVSGLPDITSIGGGPPGAACGPGAGSTEISADGWALPAHGPIVSGFRTTERPDHQGTDIGAGRNENIYASAAGTVITSMCNASTNNCDVDGGINVAGCGWYVEIDHGGITTRYCHMVREPYVHVGDVVSVGQVIGQIGSSGNSSGPHLHFEVHEGVAPGRTGTASNAVNPVAFMARHGLTFG